MKFLYSIDEIKSVVVNCSNIPKYLLDAYHPQPDQFNLLVEIIAKAQGVSITTDFTEFVKKNYVTWEKWVMLAKEYRIWIKE